ncbi:hypothetical protein [Thalassospira alkalitolerans]|uniref:hypothetical protein n=1 Tax=Thalassospira alkalitolerans TaxID=1293890 RepID=UPI0030EC3D4D
MPDKGTNKNTDPDDLLDDHLDDLAGQFMALWREQVAATADGADATSAIGRLYASLGADTSRIGEGFEAWGKLIGQMATGQSPGQNPAGAGGMPGAVAAMMPGMIPGMTPGAIPGMSMDPATNPMAAMIDQMSKMAPPGMMPGFSPGAPFPLNMAAMAGVGSMAGSPDTPAAQKPAPAKDTAAVSKVADAGPKAVGKTGKGKTKPSVTAKTAVKAKTGQGKNERAKPGSDKSTQKNKQPSRRAKAAGDASGGRDDELVKLARRIADLQETISALETGTAGPGEGPAKRDGKTSS